MEGREGLRNVGEVIRHLQVPTDFTLLDNQELLVSTTRGYEYS
jgi:hypothetical protein